MAHGVKQNGPGVNLPVYTLAFGVDGMEPISGTLDELKAILDGYDASTVQRIWFAEMSVRSELATLLRGYMAKRYVDHFCGPED